MVYQWYFPPLNGGQASGLNDSGVSYFESDPIRSIAKETLQDSIDAKDVSESKTIVKFNTFTVTQNQIPDYEGLLEAFKNGIERWDHHDDTKLFFEKGVEMLKRDSIPVLAIQDYQTTGLTKVGNLKTGGWYTLILASGVTEKASTDGGSFGIGKNAPFAASALRTVLYSTKNRDGEIGFQGIAKIPTITQSDNEDTQGVGYYFNPNERQPIKETNDILKPYQRYEYGTDKFIIGFNDEKDWKERLLDAIISNYLLAIHRDTLEVHINDFIINKSTLKKAIDIIKQFNQDSLALQYYEVLYSSFSKEFKEEFITDLNTKETITLRLLIKDGFKKRVGLHRSTGMKIFDKGHFHTPIDFSGVLIVEGERLNAVLREMEPPTHDKWDPNRFKDNPDYAKKLITNINKWINRKARDLLKDQPEKSVQIKGIEELLPDLSDEQPKTVEIQKDALKDRVSIISTKKKKKRKRLMPSIQVEGGISGEVSGGKREGKKKDHSDPPKEKGTRKARVSKVNVYCTDPTNQIYSVLVTPQTQGEVVFEFKAVGENGQTTNVDIVHARMADKLIPVDGNVIGPFNLTDKTTATIDIKINTPNRLALDVRSQ